MKVELFPIALDRAVRPGDDLASLLVAAMTKHGLEVTRTDVLAVCQKVVSKAEGRIVRLEDVTPGRRALAFGRRFGKDARLIELALREAREVLRMERGHLITATGPGWICANSGIDRSNQNAEGEVTLLPEDADRSAAHLRERIAAINGESPAVVITDTFGRPWRLGQVDFAIGAAGFAPLDDARGRADWRGRPLEHTCMAVADQLAAAAGLVMHKEAGTPAVLIRGFEYPSGPGRAADLVRPADEDLFR